MPAFPPDSVFLCKVEVDAELDTQGLTFHLQRTAEADTLWMATTYHEPHIVGTMPVADPLVIAAERMLEMAMHDPWVFGEPADGFADGLLTRQQVLDAFARVKAEVAHTKELAGRTAGQPIVVLARELGLDPTPSGTGPASWYAKCPGGRHFLHIHAETGEFGCGYCRQKGGVGELRAFASSRQR